MTAADFPVERRDALGNLSRGEWDVFDRPILAAWTLTDTGLGDGAAQEEAVTRFAYDENDNLSSVVDALSRRTEYSYDDLDRETAIRSPDGSRFRITYWRDGSIAQTEDANGTRRSYSLDPLGRIVRVNVDTLNAVTPVGGASFERFEYDALGRPLLEENDFARVLFTYDSAHRVSTETLRLVMPGAVPSSAQTVSRSYNDTGALIALRYPNGREISLEHDAAGRMTGIANLALGAGYPGNPATPDAHEILSTRWIGGRRVGASLGNGTTIANQHDGLGRLIDISHSLANGETRRFQSLFDGGGNLRRSTGQFSATRIASYDSLYRLVAERGLAGELVDPTPHAPATGPLLDPIPDRQQAIDAAAGQLAAPAAPDLQYDLAGNRQRSPWDGGRVYNVNDLDQVRTIRHLDSGIEETLTYDANGNLIQRGTLEFQYDSLNRLVSAGDGNVAIAEFFHDVRGRRVLERGAEGTVALVSDGPNIICEHRNGALFAQYVHDERIDRPVQIAAEGDEHWFHADYNRSVRALTDRTGAIAAAYEYRPFGETLQAPAAGPYNPVRHAGRRLDAKLDTYDSRFRQYAPELGRFLQRDPLGMLDGTNLYPYVGSNPLSFVDPFGLKRGPGSGATGPTGGGGVANRPTAQPPPTVSAPNRLPAIPKIDLPQAPEGTDFRKEERRARRQLRKNVPHGPGEQTQHYLKWRKGRDVGLDPKLTNDPRYMGPLQSQNRLSEGPYTKGNRSANNPHTYADRVLYPHYEEKLGPRTRTWGTERVVHVRTGRRVMREITGNSGPRPPYIVAPTAKGVMGHFIYGGTSTMVPFFAEAELVLFFGENIAYSRGFLMTGRALGFLGTKVLPVAGSFVLGYTAGTWVDEKTGWSDTLSNRAVNSRDSYRSLGLGDTTSTILGGVAATPVASDIGEGVGWASHRIYAGFTDDNYTFNPLKGELAHDIWDAIF